MERRRGDQSKAKKLPLFELSEWSRKGFVQLFQTLFGWDFAGGRKENVFFPPSFALRAMNKDIPADFKNCVLLRLFLPHLSGCVIHILLRRDHS